MWKILCRQKTKLFSLKKSKGTTIVEVLVAVIIIGIVSMYGLSFFSSSYRISVDSKDYSFVLHDLVRKIEMIKSGDYPPNITDADGNCYPGSTDPATTSPNSTNDSTIFDFKVDKRIRRDCNVHYICKAYVGHRTEGGHVENFFGSTRVECEATWPWPDGFSYSAAAAANRNRITLITYISEPNGSIGEF